MSDLTVLPLSNGAAAVSGTQPVSEAELREAAKQFEAAFIQEMLKYAGLDEAFGANEGPVTQGLSSFVLEQIAGDIADNGGFGLADQFYEKLRSDFRSLPETSSERIVV